MPHRNEHHRYGSARFADEGEIARAGLFRDTRDAAVIGFVGDRLLRYSGLGGILLTAGARGGKLASVIGYSACRGGIAHSLVLLDPKGEISALARNQTPLRGWPGKHCLYWNPCGLHGLPKHRLNPVDYIRADSPSLVSDVKVFCENVIPLSGAPQAGYFERRAREFLEGVILTIVKLDGVLTLPRLYHFLNLIPGGGDAWLDFAFEMSEAGYAVAARVEEEIAAARGKDSGGFTGILGEIFKAFAPLSDPVLMASVSPPYDFSLRQLCEGGQAYNLHLMPPAEFIEPWGAIIKSIFVGAMVYKSRAPHAPRQTWIIDECAQLGGFPLVVKLFTYGAGIGIRPFAVYQATAQMKATGPDAETIITSSAAVRIYFAVRDLQSATTLSRMLGAQTLEWDDTLAQSRARLARQEALAALLNGEDPMQVGIRAAHYAEAETHRSKQHRLLRTPDEILGMPSDKAFIFADGLSHPIYADRRPYYEQRFMAGRFHPNPYHPPHDRVRIKTRFGHDWRGIVTEPVPPEYAHYPQYEDGLWSCVEGFR